MQSDLSFLSTAAKLDEKHVSDLIKKYDQNSVIKVIKYIIKRNMDSDQKNIDSPGEYLETILASNKENIEKNSKDYSPAELKENKSDDDALELISRHFARITSEIRVLRKFILDRENRIEEKIGRIENNKESLNGPELNKILDRIQSLYDKNVQQINNVNNFSKRKLVSLTLLLFGFGFGLGALYWHIAGVLGIRLLDLRFALILGGFLAGIGAAIGSSKILDRCFNLKKRKMI